MIIFFCHIPVASATYVFKILYYNFFSYSNAVYVTVKNVKGVKPFTVKLRRK